MKRFVFVLGCLSLILTGCTVIRETQEPPKKMTEKSRIMEYELSRALLRAFLRNDAKAFVGMLPMKMRTEFDTAKFKSTRESVTGSMGEPVSFRYMGNLEMTAVCPHIWAVRFERTNREKNKTFHSELLFRVITGTVNGEPYIIGFNFF